MAKQPKSQEENTESGLIAPTYAVMKKNPAELMEVINANLGAGAELGPGDLERIKVPSGGNTTWTVPTLSGDSETKELDGIIAAFSDQRAYWEDKYSGGKNPPDCASSDLITGIGKPGGDCAKCPYSQWESATNEKGEPTAGQACKQVRMMAVVQKDDLIPILLTAPPGSLANLRKYFLRLASKSAPYYGVVTRFRLEKAKNEGGIEYSQISASAVEELPPEARKTMATYSKAMGRTLERAAVEAETATE